MKKNFIALLILLPLLSLADSHGVRYPEKAEQLRITGHVKVLYDIGVDGAVSNIRFIEAEPKYIFEREVQKGMKRWIFPLNRPRNDVSHEFTFAAE